MREQPSCEYCEIPFRNTYTCIHFLKFPHMAHASPCTPHLDVVDMTMLSMSEDYSFPTRNTRKCISYPCHPPEAHAFPYLPPMDDGDMIEKARCAH